MSFWYTIAMIIGFALLILYGFAIYSSSKKDVDVVEVRDSDDENTDTKVIIAQDDHTQDEQDKKPAMFAPFIAILATVVLILLIHSIWKVNGVPASVVAYAVAAGILLYTVAYLYSVDNDGDKRWHKVFYIYAIVVAVMLLLGWWTNSDRSIDSTPEADKTTTSTTTTTSTPTTTERETTGRLTTEGTTTREMTIREELFE